MAWFRRGDGHAEDRSGIPGSGTSSSPDMARRESSLPDTTADTTGGRGYVLLGGPQEGGRILDVPVDKEEHGFIAVFDNPPELDIPDILPRDRQEFNRLDFQHHLLRAQLRGNYAAPIGQPASILDVGCGTGRWACEMAMHFPMARVIGFDITAPATGANAVIYPGNCTFVTGNLLKGLPFANMSFDFVHMRLLFTAIPAHRWPFVVQELARVTYRGGWIELLEGGLPQNGGPAMNALLHWITEAGLRHGIDLQLGSQIGHFLRSVPTIDVVTRDIALPLGHHGGRTGRMVAVNAFAMMENLRTTILAQGITSAEQYDQALAAARLEADRGSWQCICPFYLAYGRRP
jgi:ubiquinone/menaquinone biosynthesis C-methylase UbiE